MSTEYTAAIKDGITFEQYIRQCARAMGPLVIMRDEPLDTPIPDRFEPSDYHFKESERARSEIDEINSMTDEQIEERARKEYQDKLARAMKAIKEVSELRQKYTAMLNLVKAWHPPSADHIGFKDFMMQQITSSIDDDCSTDYWEKVASQPPSPEEWKGEKVTELLRWLSYHENENIAEIDKTETRNKWIKQLIESLKQ